MHLFSRASVFVILFYRINSILMEKKWMWKNAIQSRSKCFCYSSRWVSECLSRKLWLIFQFARLRTPPARFVACNNVGSGAKSFEWARKDKNTHEQNDKIHILHENRIMEYRGILLRSKSHSYNYPNDNKNILSVLDFRACWEMAKSEYVHLLSTHSHTANIKTHFMYELLSRSILGRMHGVGFEENSAWKHAKTRFQVVVWWKFMLCLGGLRRFVDTLQMLRITHHNCLVFFNSRNK